MPDPTLPSDEEPDWKSLARHLRWTAYHAFGFTLISGPPKTAQWYERMKAPRVGDMVIETTTIHWPSCDLDGIGTLLRVTREPVTWPGDPDFVWDEAVEGAPHPTETVTYIRTLDGREFRWINASFAAVPNHDMRDDLK